MSPCPSTDLRPVMMMMMMMLMMWLLVSDRLSAMETRVDSKMSTPER